MTGRGILTVLIGEAVPPEYRPRFEQFGSTVTTLIAPLRDMGAPKVLRAENEEQAAEWHAVQVLALFDSTIPENVLTCFPNLRWVHLLGAGANRATDLGLFDMPIRITNSRGVAARPVAEWVILSMLSFVRHLPALVRQQDRRIWNRVESDEIQGKMLGLVGLGALGREIARLANALGMQVHAVRRNPSRGSQPEGIERVYPLSHLPVLMSESDFLVICLPLTPETRGLIGAQELAVMKPSGVLINVSRGGIVDEEALMQVLRDGQIAGAALDVFEREPLPADSPWWSVPNVLLSPHQAGWSRRYWNRSLNLLAENVERYLAGRPLLNPLSSRGY